MSNTSSDIDGVYYELRFSKFDKKTQTYIPKSIVDIYADIFHLHKQFGDVEAHIIGLGNVYSFLKSYSAWQKRGVNFGPLYTKIDAIIDKNGQNRNLIHCYASILSYPDLNEFCAISDSRQERLDNVVKGKTTK